MDLFEKIRYQPIRFYYIYTDIYKQLHFNKVWVKRAREHKFPMILLTIIPLKLMFSNRRLVKLINRNPYIEPILSLHPYLNNIVLLLTFFFKTLITKKIIIHLCRVTPEFLEPLKRIFPNKIKYIYQFEADAKSERDFLLEHPYKSNDYYEDYINAANGFIQKEPKYVHNCDHIIVFSPYMKDLLINRYSKLNLARKISVFSTSVNLRRIYFSEDLRQEFRKENNLEKKFVFIFLGSAHYTWQNLRKTIEIFSFLKKQRIPNAYLILAIRKSDHPIAKEIINTTDISEDEYILISISETQISKYLSGSDMGIILRHNHMMNLVASPGKFGEYIATGLPIIMSDGISNFSEIIRPTEFAIVLDNMKDEQELLNKFDSFHLFDLEKRNQLRLWTKNNFSVSHFLFRYLYLLCELAKSK